MQGKTSDFLQKNTHHISGIKNPWQVHTKENKWHKGRRGTQSPGRRSLWAIQLDFKALSWPNVCLRGVRREREKSRTRTEWVGRRGRREWSRKEDSDWLGMGGGYCEKAFWKCVCACYLWMTNELQPEPIHSSSVQEIATRRDSNEMFIFVSMQW